MANRAPWMDPPQTPNPTYQPWPHNSHAFQLYQLPNSNHPAQNPPGVFAGSMSSSGAIVDQSLYTIMEGAQPDADGEVPLEDRSNECDAVPCPMSTEGRKGSRKRSRDWTDEETSALVECKRVCFEDEGSPYRKQKSSATNWDAIAEAVRDSTDTSKTGEQCRLRWDTLVKSHRLIKERCVESGKEYAEVLAEDKRSLKLATSLKLEWYEVIDSISGKARSQKQSNPSARKSKNGGAGDGPVCAGAARTEAGPHGLRLEGGPGLGTGSIPAAPERPGMSKPRREAVQRFRSLGPQLRSTLLDLIMSERRPTIDIKEGLRESLSRTCEWLAVVQSRRRSDVYDDVSMLMRVGLVHVQSDRIQLSYGCQDVMEIDYSCFRMLDKFVKKLIGKNPVLDTHISLEYGDNRKLFVGRELMTPHQVRVLNLSYCMGLESIDLRALRKLRSLIVVDCPSLKVITGWKYLRELGWLEIHDWEAYLHYPDLQGLPSLRVCILDQSSFSVDQSSFLVDPIGYKFRMCILDQSSVLVDPIGYKFDISHYVRLHRLEILYDNYLKEIRDLSLLKCLEELLLRGCSALSILDGLSGLHSLYRLDLSGCKALGSLPDIGHMKELVYINISCTNVEEIPGIEKLVSLNRIICDHSKLRHLPNLHHLLELKYVSLKETPLIEDNQSSFYFDKPDVFFNCEEKSTLVDVTSIRDTDSSDDEDEDLD